MAAAECKVTGHRVGEETSTLTQLFSPGHLRTYLGKESKFPWTSPLAVSALPGSRCDAVFGESPAIQGMLQEAGSDCHAHSGAVWS